MRQSGFYCRFTRVLEVLSGTIPKSECAMSEFDEEIKKEKAKDDEKVVENAEVVSESGEAACTVGSR